MKNMCLWAAISLMFLAACDNEDEAVSTKSDGLSG